MHPLLQRWLEKLGIKSVNDLDEAEKMQFRQWQSVFDEDETTAEQIFQFCELQIGEIERIWADLETPEEKKGQLIPYHTVYKAILSLKNSTEQKKKQVESMLLNLLSLPNPIK